jgi:hypothetical protein
MADRDRRMSLEFVEINVEVGTANPSRINLEHDLPSPSLRLPDLLYFDIPYSSRDFTDR